MVDLRQLIFAPIAVATAALALYGLPGGEGWRGLQVPSSSRAATPCRRTLTPDEQRTGPSASWMAIAAHANSSADIQSTFSITGGA